MQLIQSLHEASGHTIDDLKKVIGKDARVKQILQSHVDIDDVQNKSEFLNTLKFFVLNNRNVIEFAEQRDYVKSLSKARLKKLRELKPTELTQSTLDELRDLVSDLFREFKHVENNGISGELRKSLVDWANGNGRYFDLSKYHQKELQSVPGLRPTRPTLLYRGLLFASHDLKERKRYDGTLEVGKGLSFLRSIREGTRIIDLEWDRASSWSTSKETAMQFARFGPASSNFGATMQWLSRKGHIDGDLGFVVSTLAQPEDVMIDMNRLVTRAHLKHGDEGEFILAPGKYTCRVYTKLTKAGEVDPIESGEVDESISSAIKATIAFSKSWVTPPLPDLDGFRSLDLERIFNHKNLDVFMNLKTLDLKKEVLESFGSILDFYKEHLANLDSAKLETLVANSEFGKIVEWINDTRKYFNETSRHPTFKTAENPRGEAKTVDLSASQVRDTAFASFHKTIKDAMSGGRFTDYSTGNRLNVFGKALGVPILPDLHRKGRKDQEAHVDSVLDAFFVATGEPKPEAREEAVSKLLTSLLAADRNISLLNKISYLKSSLDAAVSGDVE